MQIISKKAIMQKLYTLSLLLFITHFTTTHCMISEFKYEPYTQTLDQEIAQERNYITKWAEASIKTDIPKDIKIIGKAPRRTRKCFDYALYKITGNYTSATIYTDKTSNIPIEKYFQQVETPKPNDILIYTMSKEDREITHFAIVLNNGFESKLGTTPYIIQHDTMFTIPTCYGTAASCWRLKKEFRSCEGKQKLIQEIKNDIRMFDGQEDPVSCKSITIVTLGISWVLYCCIYIMQS